MYSPEEKRQAVELYIKYDKSCAAVIHELGYPCRVQLLTWYREYEENDGQFNADRYRRYSDEQKRVAVDHYLEHGRCNARTRRALGYPSQEVLSRWIDELEPGARKVSTTTALVYPEDRQAAVIALEARTASADIIASGFGVSRAQLYNWRRKYLGNGPGPMRPDDDRPSDEEAETLCAQIADLRKEVDELELRKAILEGTIDLLGEDRGTDPNRLTDKEKTLLADSPPCRMATGQVARSSGDESIELPLPGQDHRQGGQVCRVAGEGAQRVHGQQGKIRSQAHPR